jgi:hypothetical protein
MKLGDRWISGATSSGFDIQSTHTHTLATVICPLFPSDFASEISTWFHLNTAIILSHFIFLSLTRTHTHTHSNLDVTLILQKPRVSPIKHKMKENLVRVLKTTDSQVLSLFLSFCLSLLLPFPSSIVPPSPLLLSNILF